MSTDKVLAGIRQPNDLNVYISWSVATVYRALGEGTVALRHTGELVKEAAQKG